MIWRCSVSVGVSPNCSGRFYTTRMLPLKSKRGKFESHMKRQCIYFICALRSPTSFTSWLCFIYNQTSWFTVNTWVMVGWTALYGSPLVGDHTHRRTAVFGKVRDNWNNCRYNWVYNSPVVKGTFKDMRSCNLLRNARSRTAILHSWKICYKPFFHCQRDVMEHWDERQFC